MWSIVKVMHRVIGQGRDSSGLGKWVWTTYRGRDNTTLKNFAAYCPNPPSEGLFRVYTQHCSYFSTMQEEKFPRQDFLDEICKGILMLQDNMIVMLEGNDDMRFGKLFEVFSQ
jgi:hypothetical protein